MLSAVLLLLLCLPTANGAVRVMTWNVGNYLVMDRMVDGVWFPDYPKPESEKAALREVIGTVRPDVIALQEIGSEEYLAELQRDLEAEGLRYPWRAIAEGEDPVRRIAVLSRLPLEAVVAHDDPGFRYCGENIRTRRGMLEVRLRIGESGLTVFVVHLKSKWTEREDDPQAQQRRVSEAKVLRDRILSRIDSENDLYLIVGDFNDSPRSPVLARFLRRGNRVICIRANAADSRGHRWTQYWQREDLYSRVDYILVSPPLMPMMVPQSAVIIDHPAVLLASDHRPLVADFAIPPRVIPYPDTNEH